MTATPKSFCELYWWIEFEVANVANNESLNPLISSVTQIVQEISRRPICPLSTVQPISVSELAEVLESELRRGGDRFIPPFPNSVAIRRRSTSSDLAPDERLRRTVIDHIRNFCGDGGIHHGELCRRWTGPLPANSVDSLQAVKTYLETASENWFSAGGREDPELENSKLYLQQARRDLLNARHSLEWLFEQGRCLQPPKWKRAPKTAQETYGQLHALLGWINEQSGEVDRRSSPTRTRRTVSQNRAGHRQNSDELFKAALRKHHKYQTDGSIGNYKYATYRQLEELMGECISDSTVGRLVKWHFGSVRKYRAACRNRAIRESLVILFGDGLRHLSNGRRAALDDVADLSDENCDE